MTEALKNHTIEDFWRPRLSACKPQIANQLAGWEQDLIALKTFVEAPLLKSATFEDDSDPETSSIILVSAAGAVGKSTLARQIASHTDAIFLDLAKAAPVGGYTLSGGLVRAGVWNSWQAGDTALLIDGLDEARLKVTQEGFVAFIKDIAALCVGRSIPTVLFGRTGAIQDAWLILSTETVKVPITVLEIGYYLPQMAVNFATAHLKAAKPEYNHIDTAIRAITVLLNQLRQDTENDGDRFAGYAPVLQAVANRVVEDANPIGLIAQIAAGEQPVTLKTITSAILEREQRKLHSLALEDGSLKNTLYMPTEQMERLVARVYRQVPPAIPAMSASDTQAYSNALETWVSDHPFLDGSVIPTSAVFDAFIAAAALRDVNVRDVATRNELNKGTAANPFLAEFYLEEGETLFIPPEHIGLVYASLRARLSLGDVASLSIDELDNEDEHEQLKAEVEITIARASDDRGRLLSFETEQTGVIRLGRHVEDVDIVTPFAKVEIGGDSEALLTAPISIQCQKIEINAERVIVERNAAQQEGAVFLEAEEADTFAVSSVPTLNGGATLSVSWAGAEAYPWTSFRGHPTVTREPLLDEGLRRFRKFIISFRSHSKGALKRLAAKLEHKRMTKGVGRAILDKLISSGVISTDGTMFTLDAEVLTNKTGASYVSTMSQVYSKQTVAFVSSAFATELTPDD